MQILAQIKKELENYRNSHIEVCEGYNYSQAKLVRRILLYKNCIYPKGKLDSQGNYKFWFDVISPRRDAEIKNIDFDTKDIELYSDATEDVGRLMIANASLKKFLKDTGQAAKLNEAIERGTEWGNTVWKKIKDGYKLMDLSNFIVLNQIAETLEDSDVIEKEIMYSTDLRKKIGIWENVEELIKSGKPELHQTSPTFYIYERNGEISEKDYLELKGKQGGKEDKYILCKVIVGGNKNDEPTQVLFYDQIDKKPYKEYHRGTYSNRWMRVGMYEILFDIQTRANEIGNQIARGLEWSSKTVFRSSDRIIAQNILTDLQNGDIIKSTDLQQVNTRMDGLDQLIADWNRLMQIADKLANSSEVVMGESAPSGTPFRLQSMNNLNANKLFDFIREKIAIVFQDVIEDWILPELLNDLKSKDVLKLTDDIGILTKYYQMIIDEWYINNLLAFPPHSPEEAQLLKDEKMQELLKNKEVIITLEKEMWKGFKPRVIISITGENYALVTELETLKTFIQLENSPARRTALIELAMMKKGIDISKLPKTPPVQVQPAQGGMGNQQPLTTQQS